MAIEHYQNEINRLSGELESKRRIVAEYLAAPQPDWEALAKIAQRAAVIQAEFRATKYAKDLLNY